MPYRFTGTLKKLGVILEPERLSEEERRHLREQEPKGFMADPQRQNARSTAKETCEGSGNPSDGPKLLQIPVTACQSHRQCTRSEPLLPSSGPM
jgi:hypothetical protein